MSLSRACRQLAQGLLLLVWVCVGASNAHAIEGTPEALKPVKVDEQLGQSVPTDLVFQDHTGADVRLGELMRGDIPTLLTLNYYRCQTLCSVQLNGLLTGLDGLDWTAGQQFRIVTVSIDPDEGPALAKAKRDAYIAAHGRGDVEWHFLTGAQPQIQALAAAVGIGYHYDAKTEQWAHPAVLSFVSPEGVVARYIYGIQYAPQDLRFALMEAAEGRLGSPVDKLILSCFQYDETRGKYTAAAFGVMRLGGVASLFGVGLFSLFLWRWEFTHRRRGGDA